jgi:chorismate synthase
MPKKGKAKNTVNKAKHTRLMKQKENKLRLEKQRTKERLKAIIKKANKENDSTATN